MKTVKNISYIILCTLVVLFSSCEPRALTKEDVISMDEKELLKALDDENPEGYTIYNINDFLDEFMGEEGNFHSDESLYRTRTAYKGLNLFSIDTLPLNGPGIYLRGRVVTDDYGGNFYKSLVIQQVTDWQTGKKIDQQGLRISVDMGSASGLYQQGQEILIRCNGLAVGRYANEPQLCVPSYNNNIYAKSANEKTGWAAGRIPSAKFRKATRLIGLPDKKALVYDEMDLEELDEKFLSKYEDVIGARKLDARLVRIKNVHFTGNYSNYGEPVPCNRYTANDSIIDGNPELDQYAATFGPTTGNVGFPQSRYVADDIEEHMVLVSTSEYARYAYYYLPASKYEGSITGVLGFYADNGPSLARNGIDASAWAITPSNLSDILPECQKENADPRWIPTEWKLGTPQPED